MVQSKVALRTNREVESRADCGGLCCAQESQNDVQIGEYNNVLKCAVLMKTATAVLCVCTLHNVLRCVRLWTFILVHFYTLLTLLALVLLLEYNFFDVRVLFLSLNLRFLLGALTYNSSELIEPEVLHVAPLQWILAACLSELCNTMRH